MKSSAIWVSSLRRESERASVNDQAEANWRLESREGAEEVREGTRRTKDGDGRNDGGDCGERRVEVKREECGGLSEGIWSVDRVLPVRTAGVHRPAPAFQTGSDSLVTLLPASASAICCRRLLAVVPSAALSVLPATLGTESLRNF